MDKQPLGMRNNNPLNIKKTSQTFQGEIPSDNAFEKFKSLPYGIRAGIRVIHKYYFTYHLDTITKIITRWAPPNENDTKKYIETVAKIAHLNSDNKIIYMKDTILAIVKAMAYVECHVELSDKDLQEGWTLAQSN